MYRYDGPRTNIRGLFYALGVLWLALIAVSCGEDALPTPTAAPPTAAPTQCVPNPGAVDDFCTQVPLTTEPDGLKLGDIKVGTGQVIKPGDKIMVQYTGWLTDSGVQFDSSRKPGGSPFQVTVGAGRVIKGWDEGLVGMRVGGKRVLVIPPALGYGATGSPPTIPPNATLTFDVEVVSIG